MYKGPTASVSVTMKNTGTLTWTDGGTPRDPSALYRLGAQNPQDNNNWSFGRVSISGYINTGSQDTFSFTITAPSTPGTYNFQWRMVEESVEWFGGYSTTIPVKVISCSLNLSSSSALVPADGSSASTITAQASDNQPNVPISFSTTLGTLSSSSCTTSSGGGCTVTIKSSSPGVAVVTGTATGYSSSQTNVAFSDFTITPNPASMGVVQGSSSTTTITLTSINSFAGSV